MEQFKHLDAKTIELAGIAASVAGGCRPCLDFHFKEAIKIGCTIEQVTEAMKLGKMINQRPINDFNKQADMLLKNHNKNHAK